MATNPRSLSLLVQNVVVEFLRQDDGKQFCIRRFTEKCRNALADMVKKLALPKSTSWRWVSWYNAQNDVVWYRRRPGSEF